MSGIRVVRAGLFTTVQDAGRWGWQHLGVPVSGAMDQVSHRLANALVGNTPADATLEVTLDGPEIEFEDRRIVAVCGARFDMALDGKPVRDGDAFEAGAGARLRFRTRRQGARAYVAVAGGIDVPSVLGSRATHVATRMGGLGRPLMAGDVLPLGAATGPLPIRRREDGAAGLVRLPAGPASLRILPGPQVGHSWPDAFAALQSAPYQVTPDSDRMGFRLRGPAIGPVFTQALSDATVSGMVQLPSGGQPILLMADRQTMGGYPRLAIVITADMGLAGQLAPGDEIRFTACSREDAVQALLRQERALLAIDDGEGSA